MIFEGLPLETFLCTAVKRVLLKRNQLKHTLSLADVFPSFIPLISSGFKNRSFSEKLKMRRFALKINPRSYKTV